MRTLLTTLLLTLTTLATAQFQRVINESFDAKEAFKLQVDLHGTVTYQEWEGTFILLETKVVIENCNDNIFKSLIKSGRYKAVYGIDGDVVKLSSNPALRKMFKTSFGDSNERIYFKVYFPEGFQDHMGNALTSTIEHAIEPGQ